MKQILIKYFTTPYGELILGSYQDQLCLCDWRYRKMRQAVDNRIKKGLQADFIESNSAVISQTIEQLEEYFAGKREIFDLLLLMVGTEFQKKVWLELMNIPYGQTASYKELAAKLNDPAAVRAVAAANGANAISIIIPCHRIIGSSGELIGYAGGLRAKQELLRLEGRTSSIQPDLFAE